MFLLPDQYHNDGKSRAGAVMWNGVSVVDHTILSLEDHRPACRPACRHTFMDLEDVMLTETSQGE